MEYLLTIDVGNSNTKFGLFFGSSLSKVWSVDSGRIHERSQMMQRVTELLADEIQKIHHVIICSVVEEITDALLQVFQDKYQLLPHVIGKNITCPLEIHPSCDEQIGADRLILGYGASQIYGYPCIVVGCGTATTFTVIDGNGVFIGGAILPGFKTSLQPMQTNISQLHTIELSKPLNIIGTNTVDALNAGLYYGFIGQVEGVLNRIKKEISLPFKVIWTGGLSSMIFSEFRDESYIHHPNLVLDGLRLLWEKNSQALAK
ncbi:type III pantothenate kinase [Caldalkalibacillus mannanilyticus]|uniref:type III pantothenate kinase n=1 Tax=Caldalkalibacillus mannanilyticus TaxID=1418 RepID=UPI00046AE23D|nr:type III pantothenate kinase [Caldalkalibacillus mannanilyticus]